MEKEIHMAFEDLIKYPTLLIIRDMPMKAKRDASLNYQMGTHSPPVSMSGQAEKLLQGWKECELVHPLRR